VLCDVENFSTTPVAESRTVWLWLSEPRLRRGPTKICDQTRRETISSQQHRSIAFAAGRLRLSRQAHLDAGEGAPFNTIKRGLQTIAPTIIRWKQRFLEAGLERLDTYHLGQKATVLTPALRAEFCLPPRKKPQRLFHAIGVDANWRPYWASARTLCIGSGKKRA